MMFRNTRSVAARVLIAACAARAAVASADSLLDRFRAPDREARPEVWWHWLGSYATPQGIEADIRAMGEAGVKRAHIFLANSARLRGPEVLSEDWFKLFDAAVTACRRHGVTLGLHNCPGWSSSGGPWIRPEDSMKRVTATETDTALAAGDVALPQPVATCGFYRDIAVLAFPAGRDAVPVKLSGDFEADFAGFIARGAPVTLPLGKPGTACTLSWEFAAPASFSSAVFRFDENALSHRVTFETSDDGVTWMPAGEASFVQYQAQRTPKISHFPKRLENVRFVRAKFTCVDSYGWIRKGRKVMTSAAFTDLARIADADAVNASDTTFCYRPLKPGVPDRAGLDPARIVDVTAAFDAARGVLRWKAPAPGTWRIMRFGYTSTGVKNHPSTLEGLECDKLTRRGLDAHWPHMPQRILDRPGAKGIVRSMTIDSYEVGGQNWTDGFEREFRRRRGYDLTAWLPAVWGYAVGRESASLRFLHDFQRTVADLFAENYYAYFAELCHRHGILAATEAQIGPFDPVECNQFADIPMGEFWVDGGDPNGSPRYASSAAHLAGRAVVAAEAFTTWPQEGRFQITPHQLRIHGDYGWRQGISQIVCHSFVHQPFLNVKPGLSLAKHGSHITRNLTWWPEMRAWTDYVMRGQTLLQATKAHAQVLLFIGEENANARPYPHKLVAMGSDFDYCSFADIAKIAPRPNGGCGVPGGEAYDLFALGPCRHMSLRVLAKAKELLDAGARVAGLKPIGTTTREDDPVAWQRLADAIWSGAYKGRLFETAEPHEALRQAGVRAAAEARVGAIQALRKEYGDETLYFVINTQKTPFAGDVSFATPKGGAPVMLDAKTGVSRSCAAVSRDAGRTDVAIDLRAGESCFLLFTGGAQARTAAAMQALARVEILSAVYRGVAHPELKADVTAKVKALQARGLDSFDVENAHFGSPAPRQLKELALVWTADGERRETVVPEHHAFSFRVPRAAEGARERRVAELSDAWRVTFEGLGAPAPKRWATLTDWSRSDDLSLRHFAGRAFYETRFVLTPAQLRDLGDNAVLDLGAVHELARVTLNGRDFGCLWEAPYRVAVQGALRAGTNTLEAVVYNTWPNRLIGDAIARRDGAREPMRNGIPEWVLADRPDSGTGIHTWSNFGDAWNADDPLRPAGLVGPVGLVAAPVTR